MGNDPSRSIRSAVCAAGARCASSRSSSNPESSMPFSGTCVPKGATHAHSPNTSGRRPERDFNRAHTSPSTTAPGKPAGRRSARFGQSAPIV